MKNTIWLIAVILLIYSISSMAETTLSFNPEVGKKYTYSYQMTQKIKQKPYNQINRDIFTSLNIVFTLNTIKKSSDAIQMEYVFDEIAYTTIFMGSTVEYSSAYINTRETLSTVYLTKVARNFIGKPFSVTFRPDASISYISGVDSIMPELLNVNMDPTLISNYGYFFDRYKKEGIKKVFESMFMAFPPKPIALNEKWDVNNTTTIWNKSGKMKNTMTLKSQENGLVNIEQFSAFDLTKDTLRIYRSAGGLKGNIVMDSNTGMIQKRNQKEQDAGYEKTMFYDLNSDIRFKLVK